MLDVCDWLAAVDLAKLVARFSSNFISGADLLNLKETDLMELDVGPTDRQTLLQQLRQMTGEQPLTLLTPEPSPSKPTGKLYITFTVS